MIRCNICKIEKPESDFFPSYLKGRDFRCKVCLRPATRKRMRRWRERNPELAKQREKNGYLKHKEKVKAYSRKYSKLNRFIKNAQLKANYYLKLGKIKKENCLICGDPKAEMHHHDYLKPLEVIWLCTQHHRRLHNWIYE